MEVAPNTILVKEGEMVRLLLHAQTHTCTQQIHIHLHTHMYCTSEHSLDDKII